MITNTYGTKFPILKLKTLFNTDVIRLVLKGNNRNEVGRQRFRVFPTSASEASNPQTVKRG